MRVIFTNTILTSSSIELGEIPATWGESFGDFHFMDNGANELNSLNTTFELNLNFSLFFGNSLIYCHAAMFLFSTSPTQTEKTGNVKAGKELRLFFN